MRTSLLIRPPSPAALAESHLNGATQDFLDRLHGAYLSTLDGRGLLEGADFTAWEAVLAVARMSEPVPTADLARIWEAWRGGRVQASNPAVEGPSPRD